MGNFRILLSLLLQPITIPFADGTLYETLPILWMDTQATLKSGESEIKLLIKFHRPCESFYDSRIVNGTKDYFVKWCNEELDKIIIAPLETMCAPAFANIHSRRKRFLKKVSSGVKNVFRGVGGVVSSIFGIGSRSHPDPRIEPLISRVNSLAQTTLAQTTQLKELEYAMDTLEERVRTTETDVKELQEWKAELIQTLGTTMTLVSKLAAYFEISKSHMSQVMAEWKETRLSGHLFDIFMMDWKTNRSVIEVFRRGKPISCHIDNRNGVATFLFKKEDTDFGVHVLKANPFTLYQQIPGSYLGYKLEYVGPSQVAYDSGSNCLVPYSGTASEVVLFPGQNDCSPIHELSVYKYWRKTCEPMYYLDETGIQFKVLGDSYYIYCFGFNVTIYKQVLPCPNYVFKIHVNETIEIMNGKSRAKTLRPQDVEPTPDFYSSKIVYHLMPQIMKLNIDSFNVSNNCPFSTTEKGQSLVATLGIVGVVMVVLVLLLVVGIFIFYLRCRVQTKDPGVIVDPHQTGLLSIQSRHDFELRNIYEEIPGSKN